MRIALCVALMLCALMLFTPPTRTTGCTDMDGDGDCQPSDCNDNNPDQNSLDLDGDGYSSCVNDCEDNDPTINRCKVSRQQYPYIYYPPEEECYRVHETYDYYSCPPNGGTCVYVRSWDVWSTQCL